MQATKSYTANAQTTSATVRGRDASINVAGVFVATLSVTKLTPGKNGGAAVPCAILKPDGSIGTTITGTGDFFVLGVRPGDTITVATTAYTSGTANLTISDN